MNFKILYIYGGDKIIFMVISQGIHAELGPNSAREIIHRKALSAAGMLANMT